MSPFLLVRCLLLLACLVVSHTDLYMENECRSSVTYLFGPDAGILPTSGDHPRPTPDQHEIMERKQLQGPPKLACRSGYRLYNSKCYKAFTNPLNWDGAHSACMRYECGELARPRTEDIDKLLISLKNAADPKSDFWFGLRRHRFLSRREQFHWVRNSTDIVDMNNSYTNWAPGKPDDVEGDEDCVLYVARDSEFPDTWNDDSCFTSLPFLCSTKPLGNPACPFS